MTSEDIARLRKTQYNSTVVKLAKVHSDLLIMRVKPDNPRPVHKPGQYTALGLGFWEPRFPGCQEENLNDDQLSKLARRSYSISCSVLDDNGRLMKLEENDWLEFYIVLVRGDTDTGKAPALTPRLFLLKEGDRLFMQEKITGHFTLDPVKAGDTILFLSTGTGEAPHNYLLWDLLQRGHQGRILQACCVRYKRDLAYLGIQQELMKRYPNYTYLDLTTREKENEGKKVYIQALLTGGEMERILGLSLDPARTHVYLCGNPKMIGVPVKDRETGTVSYPQPLGVIEILTQRGFQLDQPATKFKGNIHFEEYW